MAQRKTGNSGANAGLIELRVDHLDALFDAYDPMPAPSRDLAPQAEDFIVGWARELPSETAFRILVHTHAAEAASSTALHAEQAFQRHFNYRAEKVGGDIAELLRIGRVSLLIGLAVLALCYAGGRALMAVAPPDLALFGRESLLILGWVANWRPIEIFLYDWWPLARRRALLKRLAAAPVEIRADL